MDDIYRETILDYYRHPHNKETIDHPDVTFTDVNPLCGDAVGIHLALRGTMIEKARFSGNGCAISQAATSMLCEHVEGKTLAEAKTLTREDITEMLGIQLTPVRLKCALLGLHVLHKGIADYEKKRAPADL